MKSVFATRRRGVSLIEILVAIVIVLVLALIVYPIVGYSQRTSTRVGCISNLRTIYGGIVAYTADHGGRLPGPQFQAIEMGKGGHMTGRLQIYLDNEKKSDLWRCPANIMLNERNLRAAKNNQTEYAAYVARTPFFGYNYAPPRNSIEPMTLLDVEELYPLQERWLLADIDYWFYPDANRVGGQYPPVHEGRRNYLMWNGSIDLRTITR